MSKNKNKLSKKDKKAILNNTQGVFDAQIRVLNEVMYARASAELDEEGREELLEHLLALEEESLARAAIKAQEEFAEPAIEEIPEMTEELMLEAEEHFPDAFEQDMLFGRRAVGPMSDSVILYDRFAYKFSYKCKNVYCDQILDLKSGKKIGMVPPMRLSTVWQKVQDYDKKKKKKTFDERMELSYREWRAAYYSIDKYISRAKDRKADAENLERTLNITTVKDVMNLSELTYEKLFIKKADKIIQLINLAIFAELKENTRLEKIWGNIRNYHYKVSLSEKEGGIFSEEDTRILNDHGIYLLNDIGKHNFYELKGMLLEHSFANIVTEINEAFKEDLAKRRDRRLRVYPMTFAFLATVFAFYVGYETKYTIIKNTTMSICVAVCAAIWGLCLITMLMSMLRAAFRRKKLKVPVFFTKAVKRALTVLALCTIVTGLSMAVFYLRYDGYDNTVYYRDLGDGKISVAGLRQEYIYDLKVPEMIDGKTVVEVEFTAFYGEDMRYVTLPETVTKLDDHAFNNCRRLVSVSMPGVKRINKSAFEDCKELTSIEFGDSIEIIGEKSFFGCSGLSELIVPDSVRSIGKKAFSNCLSLVILQVPFVGPDRESSPESCLDYYLDCKASGSNSNVTINDVSIVTPANFKDCFGLRSVTLSDKVSVIDDGAFEGLSIRSVTLPSSITGINTNTFRNCASLRFIQGAQNVVSIGDAAFEGCTALEEISFPSVKNIGNAAFRMCTVLEDLGELSSLETVGESAFELCDSLENVNLSQSRLTSLSKKMFHGCSSLYNITLPSTVNSIGDGALAFCAIELFDFAEIEYIGDEAFYGSGLIEIVIPSSVTHIGKNSFAQCEKMDTAILPFLGETLQSMDGGFIHTFGTESVISSLMLTDVTYVNASMLEGGERLSSVTLPNKLERIDPYSFEGFVSLGSMEIPNGVTTIGEGAFLGCANIGVIIIPESVTNIGAKAFMGCEELEEIVIPSGVKAIYDETFSGCMSLEIIDLPTGLSSIGASAFNNCSKLGSITLPDGLTSIGNRAFADCSSLLSLEIPTSVSSIGQNIIVGCGSLSTLSIPFIGADRKTADTITYIVGAGPNNIENIIITNADTIAEGALKDCSALTKLSLNFGIKEIGKDVVSGCTKLAQVLMSDELAKKYTDLFPKGTVVVSDGN